MTGDRNTAHGSSTSGDVLAKICADKRGEIEVRKAACGQAQIERRAAAAPPPQPFAKSLQTALDAGRTGLIAEIKKASPSKGLIREDFVPVDLARAYESAGASCLSVLTDTPYFQGSDTYLEAARAAVSIPVLRKDFTLDTYQVYEARAIGADCILLIMAALEDAAARELARLASRLGMDVLAEIHDEAELARAVEIDEARLIGVNNRNLKTLSVDIATAEFLAPRVPPDRIAVAESGLHTPDDLQRMAAAGARCVLVGESLMRQPDVAAATRALLGETTNISA